ncbi:MAG: 2-oxoglutarate dehydrogenase, E2 component, dihydrolipoamide succinyltransferase, partial [Demequina sp.]
EPEPEPEPEPAPEPEPEPEQKSEPAPEPEPKQESESAPESQQESDSGGGDTRDVTLPALGESVTEGTVTRWLKSVGDAVEADEPLVEVSTDKVDTEIPSPFAGTLTEILVEEDQTVEVDTVIARIGAEGASPAAPTEKSDDTAKEQPTEDTSSTAAPAEESTAETEQKNDPEPKPEPKQEPKQDSAPKADSQPSASAASSSTDGSGYVTPIVRKLAADKGVDLDSVSGSGVGGRIRKDDILKAAQSAGGAPKAEKPSAPAPQQSAQVKESPLRGTTEPMSRVRKVVAKVMMDSLHNMAQLTTVVEVDVSRVWALRAKAKASFQEREDAKLTFLPFFTLAAAEALKEHAFLNASIDGDNVIYHPSVNLGIAVDTDKGLMVPVIKDADSKSLADHAREIADLADRARSGGLKPDEMSGATFSVTNTGSGGTIVDTPIVASPQVGIMATCAIVKKPVVVTGPDGGDVISIRPMCYLPLSYDHRLVDGADAARFLQSVKSRIEEGAFEAELGL